MFSFQSASQEDMVVDQPLNEVSAYAWFYISVF